MQNRTFYKWADYYYLFENDEYVESVCVGLKRVIKGGRQFKVYDFNGLEPISGKIFYKLRALYG